MAASSILGPDGKPFNRDWPGDGFAVPQVLQIASLVGAAWHTYYHNRRDEALRNSREHAQDMRRDIHYAGCLRERYVAVRNLKHHIAVDNEKDKRQKAMKDGLQRIINATPHLKRVHMSLLPAIWFGRAANQREWEWQDMLLPDVNFQPQQQAPMMVQAPVPQPALAAVGGNGNGAVHYQAFPPASGNGAPSPGGGPTTLSTPPANRMSGLLGGGAPAVITDTEKKRPALLVKQHAPVHGDSVGHHWDGTPLILMSYNLAELTKCELLPSEIGGRWVKLSGSWRERFCVHSYDWEPAEYFDWEKAAGVHGMGLRDTLYLWWDFKQELRSWCTNFLQRAGNGVRIWYYKSGNDAHKAAVEKAARQQSDRVNILVPVLDSERGSKQAGGMEVVEAPMGGLEAQIAMIKYIEDKEERFLIGQSMSTGTDGEGSLGGTGRAQFAENTKLQNTIADAEDLAESYTQEWVKPVKNWTYPECRDIPAHWQFNVPDPETKEKLEAVKTFIGLGGDVKKDEVRSLTGMSDPQPGDDILGGQQPGGMPPGMGGPPGGGGPPGPNGQAPPGGNGDGADHDADPDGATVAEGNPYAVRKQGSGYAVVKKDGGAVVPGGQHATKAEALKHFQALEINVMGKERHQRYAGWDESQHPRGQPENAGEFGHGGGQAAAKGEPAPGRVDNSTAIKDARERAKSWIGTLEDEEKEAVIDYTLDSAVNSRLRSGTATGWRDEEAVEAIDEALGKAELPHETTLFRGVRGGPFEAGEEFSDDGYTSASGNPHTAADFASGFEEDGDTGSVFEMRLPKGFHAAYIAGLSPSYASEGEFLLPRGLVFKVIRVGAGNCYVVEPVHSPARHQRYAADQDRVPAGHPDGGRFTNAAHLPHDERRLLAEHRRGKREKRAAYRQAQRQLARAWDGRPALHTEDKRDAELTALVEHVFAPNPEVPKDVRLHEAAKLGRLAREWAEALEKGPVPVDEEAWPKPKPQTREHAKTVKTLRAVAGHAEAALAALGEKGKYAAHDVSGEDRVPAGQKGGGRWTEGGANPKTKTKTPKAEATDKPVSAKPGKKYATPLESRDVAEKAADAKHAVQLARGGKRVVLDPKAQRPGFQVVRLQPGEGGKPVYHGADGQPLPEEMQQRCRTALKPGWGYVQVSDDPDARMIGVGYDDKGKIQSTYAAKHSEQAGVEKFLRVQALVAELPQLEQRIRETLDGPNHPDREAAATLLLMRKTGFRIGSEEDTGTEHEALGATTLTADNVKIDGDRVSFSFVGKHAVNISQEIEDRELAALLGPRVERGGKLFATDRKKVEHYLHSIDGVFKPKDLRTVVAAETALDAMAGMPTPTGDKEFRKAQLAVAEKVAAKLGNTPNVALKSYIIPEVFHRWLPRELAPAQGEGS